MKLHSNNMMSFALINKTKNMEKLTQCLSLIELIHDKRICVISVGSGIPLIKVLMITKQGNWF